MTPTTGSIDCGFAPTSADRDLLTAWRASGLTLIDTSG